MRKQRLTFIRVWWANGCWSDHRPAAYRELMQYKDMSKAVVATRKVRRVPDVNDLYVEGVAS